MLQDSTLVADQVATALGIDLKDGASPATLLARRLKSRELLILLDNCEQVIDGVARLPSSPWPRRPASGSSPTSREPLACGGEQVYRLPLLAVPSEQVESAAEALASSSVALLVDRLQAADLRFELTDAMAAAAGAICRRLDGLPLAIEMVGGLAPGLGLDALAARLEASFRLPYSVTRTVTPRHRSLETTLDWSHTLLSFIERVAMRRLAVFPGPFSLHAVEAVIADEMISAAECGDVLAGLVRKSLVSIDPASSSYRLLETIRTYAAEKLDAAGEMQLLRARHARHVGDVLARAYRSWGATPDGIWLDRIGWVLPDLRASLHWSFGTTGDPTLGQTLAGASRPLWPMLNLSAKGAAGPTRR